MLDTGNVSAQQELTVSAAASLTNAFPEIGKKFESANTGTKVIFNFAASGPLLQQIEAGAPVDVFASADQKTMDQAQEKNLILKDSRKNFVSNKLVLIVPATAKISIKSLQDLSTKDVTRIAIGKSETVPVGRYTQEALTNEGLWESLNAKFIPADSVRQVLDYVSRREVDAGFVFATDAAIAKDKVRIVATMEMHKPIVYPVAVVSAMQKKEFSQRFIDFVLSKEGQEILSQHGFGKP
ncbi:MAG TPA: molybdate ABC transporter substrate-binding protein [Syntrophobacteraceae bacterium]|nr:molybdate ABC transporter substrate-binding protein [Syntrophobacteraceae bacterium]